MNDRSRDEWRSRHSQDAAAAVRECGRIRSYNVGHSRHSYSYDGARTSGAGHSTRPRTRARCTLVSAILFLAVLVLPAFAADPLPPQSFFADRRAHEVGDMVTVLITEFSSVEATARTSTNKSESARAALTHHDADLQGAAVDFNTDFAGGGQIERSGKLLAKLAVTVAGVDDVGNLIVQGEQEISVNNERQRIRLEGKVRPEDIGPDNTIPSWRVAAAHIEFTGKGLLARKQAPGLLTRILSWFGE